MKYIYLHGFASSPKSKKAQFFKKQFKSINISIEIPDLNCNNFKDLTLTDQILTIENIIKKDPKEKYVLIGSSLGGYISILCANLTNKYPLFNKIEKLVLLAPALEFSQRILKREKERFKEWKSKGYIDVQHYQWNKTLPLSYKFYLDAKKYENLPLNHHLPVLIFHGTYDETVPYIVSINYMKKNPKCQTLLLNSDHSLLNELKLLWEYTSLFLKL